MSENIAPEKSAARDDIAKDVSGPQRRTAVLVVHGMGSQRALDTVRGVVNAVWLDKDEEPGPGDKRFWLHRNASITTSICRSSPQAR